MDALHLIREAAHEHPPTRPRSAVDRVDLEGDVGVVGRGQLGALIGTDDDDSAIDAVVDREDQRVVLGVHPQPTDLLGLEELVALVGIEDAEFGVAVRHMSHCAAERGRRPDPVGLRRGVIRPCRSRSYTFRSVAGRPRSRS